MHIDQPVLEARLLRRYKRFLADVQLPDGTLLTAHCPNTGSLLGCTPEGARVVLRDSQNPARKLRYTLQAVEVEGAWVNVDTSLANGIVAGAIEAAEVPELAGYATLRREVAYGTGSRIDLLLTGGPDPDCFVEVKSTTLVRGTRAAFPDAVTLRGQKHLLELEKVARNGQRAVIFFCIARDDVASFTAAEDIDPEYGKLLRRVAKRGVEVLAYTTRVEPGRIDLGRPLPIDLQRRNTQVL